MPKWLCQRKGNGGNTITGHAFLMTCIYNQSYDSSADLTDIN